MAEPATLKDTLDASLAQSINEAEALRELARSQPPTEVDLAQALSSMRLVDLFLSDLNEALRQLFVAGLSFPDPELPDALGEELHREDRLRAAGRSREQRRATGGKPAAHDVVQPLELHFRVVVDATEQLRHFHILEGNSEGLARNR